MMSRIRIASVATGIRTPANYVTVADKYGLGIQQQMLLLPIEAVIDSVCEDLGFIGKFGARKQFSSVDNRTADAGGRSTSSSDKAVRVISQKKGVPGLERFSPAIHGQSGLRGVLY